MVQQKTVLRVVKIVVQQKTVLRVVKNPILRVSPTQIVVQQKTVLRVVKNPIPRLWRVSPLAPIFKKVQLTLKLTEMYTLVLDALRGRPDFDRGRPDFDSHVVGGSYRAFWSGL